MLQREWELSLIHIFIEHYQKWAKKKGYHQSESKASQIYRLAKDGIPTIPSNAPSTKMLVLEAVKALREVNSALFAILTRMQELARTLPEYPTVRAMGGVGDILSVKLIAEIGDVRRFHSSKGLIAYAGIDPPPYESGKLIGTNRHITKRGSATCLLYTSSPFSPIGSGSNVSGSTISV